jgi:hypothetical protein
MFPSLKAAYISSLRLTRPKQASKASVTRRVRVSFSEGGRRRVLCALGLFAFLALNTWAQGLMEIQPVAPDHQFTDSDLAGKWYTLRDETLDFQAGGTLVYTKGSEAAREGGWFVSNGTVWLTWQGEGGVPVMAMKVTAFNAERVHLEGLGGKSRAVLVRQKPLVKSQVLETRLNVSPKSGGSDSMRPEISIAATPHLDYHGGPVVDHPKLHVMYWNHNWDSVHSDPAFKRGAIDTWTQAYMSGNYFDKAGQYGVHSGQLDSSDGNISLLPDPGGSTDSVLIHLWATAMIETPFTGVPYPCGNDLYAVMLPKGTSIDNGINKTCSSFGAYHLMAPILVPPSVCGFLDPFFPTVRFVPYTIIPVDCATKAAGPNGFYRDVDELTSLISHETIEAMTDPIDSFAAGVPVIGGIVNAFLGILGLSPGWYDNSAANPFTDSEAGDICEKRAAKEVWLNNSLVSSYWSNSDNDCAAGPGVVRTFSLLQIGVPSGTPVPVTFDTRVPDVNQGGGFTINVATNTMHNYSYPSPLSGGAGTRYVTNQPPGNVLVTDTFSVTAPYTTQYFLTVNTNPAAAATGNVSLTPSGWYDKGPFTIHSDQTVAVVPGTRYNFNSWGGGISANTHDFAFTLDGPKTATADYALQYLVNFTETGIPPGPVWNVNVDGTPHAGPFPDWVNAGTTLHYAYDKVVVGTPGTCYVLGGVSPASPLTVSAPTTVTGAYNTQTVPQAIVSYQLVGVAPAAAGLSFVTYCGFRRRKSGVPI